MNKGCVKLILFVLGLFFITGLTAQILTVDGHSFLLDDKPFKMWGVRVASASQSDEYTDNLIANLDDYKATGINTISIYLQGSSGGYSDPFENNGFVIGEAHLKRYKKIITECGKRDMVVVAGIFYQRTIRDSEISNLETEEDIRNAVKTFTKELQSFPNIIINIANEQNSGYYRDFTAFDFNQAENIISLCEEVKKLNKRRIVGGGGYNDSLNVIIGKSKFVDVLLFDTYSGDVEKSEHSGWHYNFFRSQGVPDKPMVNVEIFGGWTKMFRPQGVYTNEGKEIHLREIKEAKKQEGLYVHFHSNPWFQGVAQGLGNRYDLGGLGTKNDPGVRWYFNQINDKNKL